MDIFLSPKSQTFLLFFPPPLGDHFFESFHSSATPPAPYSSSPNVCRRHGTSEPVAGSYSWSLKSSIPLLFFFGGEHLAFITFPFRFTFISAIKPFGIAGFPFLLRILPAAVGIYFLSIVIRRTPSSAPLIKACSGPVSFPLLSSFSTLGLH